MLHATSWRRIRACVERRFALSNPGDSVEGAREHALWALRANSDQHGALTLSASIKARQSLWLGLWWRYSAYMGGLGDRRQITVLICAFVFYRLLTSLAEQHGYPMMASGAQFGWLAICVYSWVGPGMFQRAVSRELERVSLRPDY
ncbi:MAG: hypothetical protein KF718_27475 [Polyangiaceae bacterium]|nr:hypothetical protein [Polyangiaceae bacterium]